MDLSEETISSNRIKINNQNIKGWTSTYMSDQNKCPDCENISISKPRKPRGIGQAIQIGRNQGQPVTIESQYREEYYLVIRKSTPLQLNIGDSLMVTLDVIYLIRDIVHKTGSPSTAVGIVLNDIRTSCKYMRSMSTSQLEWVNRKLTAGYEAVEALDKDESETQICLVCGLAPPIELSDGGEDICLSMKQEHFDTTPGFENGEFTPEQALKFYDELKIFHVGALVSSALQMKRNFRANWSTVPPFMRKEYMGKTIYNTETKKDTRYLDSKVIFGEQQLLFEMLQEGTFSID